METGKTLQIDLIASHAIDARLPILFMSPDSSEKLPDAVEVEIGSMGRYLRPPVDDVGFLPLNAFLQKSGWAGRILPNRLATATKEGNIFALPHDVHPVTLTFRDDLFREAGVPLTDAAGNSTVSHVAGISGACRTFSG